MDEAVGELGELFLGQREDEVVAAVAAEGERAVVLAESYPPSADFVLRVWKICVSLQIEKMEIKDIYGNLLVTIFPLR